MFMLAVAFFVFVLCVFQLHTLLCVLFWNLSVPLQLIAWKGSSPK